MLSLCCNKFDCKFFFHLKKITVIDKHVVHCYKMFLLIAKKLRRNRLISHFYSAISQEKHTLPRKNTHQGHRDTQRHKERLMLRIFFLKQRGSSKGSKRNTTNRHERERPHLKTAAEVSHAVRQQVNTGVLRSLF